LGLETLQGDTVYEEYWGLKEKPFENTPDPKFLYYSRQHREALLNLEYAVRENKGAVMLTGDYGCGKTLLSRALISKLEPDRFDVGLVANPLLSEEEFLQEVLYQLGFDQRPTAKAEILRHIEEVLFRNAQAEKITIILIDEAQLIQSKVIFEELRLLLNFQLNDRFLLTLVLVGQVELRAMVKAIPQFDQRIAIKCHLGALSPDDTKGLILHRLAVAGRTEPIFSEEAMALIHEHTEGTPRRINNICDVSLLIGFSRGLKEVDVRLIRELISSEKEL